MQGGPLSPVLFRLAPRSGLSADLESRSVKSERAARRVFVSLYPFILDSGVRSNELEVSASVSKAYGMLRTSQLGEPL